SGVGCLDGKASEIVGRLPPFGRIDSHHRTYPVSRYPDDRLLSFTITGTTERKLSVSAEFGFRQDPNGVALLTGNFPNRALAPHLLDQVLDEVPLLLGGHGGRKCGDEQFLELFANDAAELCQVLENSPFALFLFNPPILNVLNFLFGRDSQLRENKRSRT